MKLLIRLRAAWHVLLGRPLMYRVRVEHSSPRGLMFGQEHLHIIDSWIVWVEPDAVHD